MKRKIALVLALLLLCAGCAGNGGGALVARAKREKDLLLTAAREMRGLGAERIYAALEVPEATETATGDGETTPPEARLVRYVKSSDTHVEMENEVLETVLRDFGFALILFQTASDGRESVIFSTGKESDAGVVRGVSYSFDSEPVAWWGRSASLTRHRGRYVEINPKGDAWYYTTSLGDGLWYWEKNGTVLG